MSSVATIELFDDYATVRRGAGASKRLGLRELVQSINVAAESSLQYTRHETLRLPHNTYLSLYAGNILNLCCYFPEHPGTVTHFKDKYDIMIPNTVIHFSLKILEGGQRHEVIDTRYYCTTQEVDNLPAVIPGRLPGVFTYMPFPNFYDDFRMCFGGNALLHRLEGGDLRMLKMYYDVIEGSPFNDDLRLHSVRLTSNKSEWFKYMHDYYAEHKAFPYKELAI